MKKLAIIGLVLTGGVLAMVLAMTLVGRFSPTGANAAGHAPTQADHALLDVAAGDHIYCGAVSKPAPAPPALEPTTLHVAASSPTNATLTVHFGDNDSVSFAIPANTSFSFSQAMGGVPGVDDLVRVDLSGTGGAAWVSIQAPKNAVDPFGNETPAQTDNFCTTVSAAAGAEAAPNTLTVPSYSYVGNAPSNLPPAMDANQDSKLD